MVKPLVCVFAILLSAFAIAEDLVISKLFTQTGVDGTLVISSLKRGPSFIHNDARARQRFSPASTFKIMNTLISVDENAITDENEVFTWDGYIYDVLNWNRDQTLASAFKVSCVWCYQILARRVGAEKYAFYLKQSNYGRLQRNFSTTKFWLDGSLQISALEQVRFLKKIVNRELPFSKKAYDILKQIMLVEKAPAYSLWAKTGWATNMNTRVGWYVGYVETQKDLWLFALNMDIQSEKDLPLRQELVLDSLRSKGMID